MRFCSLQVTNNTSSDGYFQAPGNLNMVCDEQEMIHN